MTVAEFMNLKAQENKELALNIIDQKNAQIDALEKKNRQLQSMINTAIGISYDKDEEEAIKYLENEKNHYPDLFNN